MATKRLIDANVLMEHLDKCIATTNRNDRAVCLCIKCFVDLMPVVDAVEVVHGRWEKAEYHGFLRCSECKDVYIDDTWVADGKWNYCPNCGADMRERENDG